MRAEEFDQKFDDGEDITGDLDLGAIHRPALEHRRVNVDFPSWMVDSLDREARQLGVTRQSIIKVWIAERLEHCVSPHIAGGGSSGIGGGCGSPNAASAADMAP
jgi:hypothetical protein